MAERNGDWVLDEVRRLLAERLAETGVEPAALDEDAAFTDLGIDSIDLVVVLTHFEQEHDLAFENEEVDVEFYPNLGGLAGAIVARLPT